MPLVITTHDSFRVGNTKIKFDSRLVFSGREVYGGQNAFGSSFPVGFQFHICHYQKRAVWISY